jgi:hypothetical protein
MMFLDCPAYLDQDGAVRCGLPAEVRCRFTMHSTDGPIESAMIGCPAGHHFTGAIESLTWDGKDNHRDFPAEPERKVRGPNTAPFYYLGRPAAVWITAMRPPGRRPASSPASVPPREER